MLDSTHVARNFRPGDVVVPFWDYLIGFLNMNQALDGAFIYYTSPTSQPRSIEVFVAVEEVPVKRTFVHFDVPRQDCDRAMKFSILLGLGFRVEYIPQIDPVLQVHRYLPL